jgi:hypothetical protein
MYFSRHGGWSRKIDVSRKSGLEDGIAEQVKNKYGKGHGDAYEQYKISYDVPVSHHVYTPDFVLDNGIIIEAKGIFSGGATERKKYILVKQQYPHLDIRFIFSNPQTKLYKGSKTTYGDWAEKNGFLYARKFIPDSWFLEEKKDTTGLVRKEVKEEEC